MKLCLLTTHPEVHSTRRMQEEAQCLGLDLCLQNPLRMSFTIPPSSTDENFDLTLNRVSAVEGDAFLYSLLGLSK